MEDGACGHNCRWWLLMSPTNGRSSVNVDAPPELDSLPDQVRAVQLASSSESTTCSSSSSSSNAGDGPLASVSAIQYKKPDKLIRRGFFDSKPTKAKALPKSKQVRTNY